MTDEKTLVVDVMAALAEGNDQPFLDAMHDDMKWTWMGSGDLSRTFAGKASVLNELWKSVKTDIVPPFKVRATLILAEGEYVVVEGVGIKRGHQFDKVEMYIFSKPEESENELKKMLADAEQTCAQLGLTYRILQLCTGDIGFNSTITFDLEVWAPGCGEWLEVSSVSNVEDFQARRANIKYRPADSGKTRLVHTLNGSGLGLPRTMIAVLENYQQADGSILVPEVLKPWMGGIDRITAS